MAGAGTIGHVGRPPGWEVTGSVRRRARRRGLNPDSMVRLPRCQPSASSAVYSPAEVIVSMIVSAKAGSVTVTAADSSS